MTGTSTSTRNRRAFSAAAIAAAFVAGAGAAVPVARAAESRIPISKPVTITASGTYVLTRDVAAVGATGAIVVDRANVSIDLNGHTVTGSLGSAIEVRNEGTLRLSDGFVSGGQTGLAVYGTPDAFLRVAISGVEFRGMAGWAINASELADLEVTNCSIRSSAGIALVSRHRPGQLRISDSVLQVTWRAISVDGDRSVRGGLIAGNRISTESDAGIVLLGHSSGVALRGNTVTTGAGTGIYAGGDGGHAIEGNVIRDTAGVGIQVPSDGHRIVGNLVSHSGSHGVEATGRRNLVEGNHSDGNSGTGIALNGPDAVYRGNMSRGNGGGNYAPGPGSTDGGGNL